jgi:hypothetical protein
MKEFFQYFVLVQTINEIILEIVPLGAEKNVSSAPVGLNML